MRLYERIHRLQIRADGLHPGPRVVSVALFAGGPTPPEDRLLYPGAYHRRQGTTDPTPLPADAKVYLFDALEGL